MPFCMGVYILIIQGHKVAVNGNRGANSVTTLKAVRKCKLTISEKNFAAAWVFYIIWNLRRPTQRIKTTIGWNLQNVCNVSQCIKAPALVNGGSGNQSLAVVNSFAVRNDVVFSNFFGKLFIG